ncbi:isopeptide-forming domain-containing fimbrial protein, partial [Listeria grayi]
MIWKFSIQIKKVDRNADPNKLDISEANGWKKYTSGELPDETTAVFYTIPGPISSSKQGGQQAFIEFYITPTGNASGDIYRNTVTANSDDGLKLQGNMCRTAVVDRDIQGKAWIDGNKDGLVGASETVLKDVPIKLYKESDNGSLEEITENLEGDDITSLKTDENGNYLIKHLDEGNYRVGFDLSKELDTGNYFITKKGINASDPSSKIDENNKEGDYYLTDAYVLPATSKLTTDHFVLDNINAGITAFADFELKKNVLDKDGTDINNQNVHVDDVLTYQLTVKNPVAGSQVDDIQITDEIPQGLEYVKGTLKVNDKTIEDKYIDGQKLDYRVDKLAGASEYVVKFDVKVTNQAKGTLTNIAEAYGKDNGIDFSKEDSQEVTSDSTPKITKSIEDKAAKYKLGDIVTYKIIASNEKGAPLNEVNIGDELTNDLDYVKGSTTINGQKVNDNIWSQDNKLTYTTSELVSGSNIEIVYKAKIKRVPTNGEIKNTAVMNGKNPWGADKNVEDTVSLQSEMADNALTVKKTVETPSGESLNGKTVQVGDKMRYTIVATNQIAGTELSGVTIEDAIASELTVDKASLKVEDEAGNAVAYDGGIDGNNLSVVLEKLAHGHPVSVSFEVTVSEAASGEITNIATGKVPGNDETPEDNQKVDVPVTPSLKKTASVQEAKLGDTYEYQIEVGNEAGGGKWNNIAIRDQLPAELSYVAGSTKVNGQAVSDDAWAAGKYEAT